MFYFLWKAKKVSMTRKSTNILGKLIDVTVETGLACTTTMITALLTFHLSPTSAIFAVPLFMVGKFYSTSVLTVSPSL